MSSDSETRPASRTVKVSEFKDQCLKLMDELAESGEGFRLLVGYCPC